MNSPILLSCFLYILGMNITHAQDTLLHRPLEYHLEQQSLLRQNRAQLTEMSALRPFQWQYSGTQVSTRYHDTEQKFYDWQRGSGTSNFDVDVQSYLRDIFPGTTVWGVANYNAYTRKKLAYNHSLDYDKVYPYFLADSIGGDLHMEEYSFGGGLAKEFGKWTIGGDIHIQANQGYRNRDPRPDNKSSDVSVEIGVSYPILKSHRIGLSVNGSVYKQTSSLSFVGELGMPLIMNLNGLGSFNNLLTGMRGSSAAKVFFASEGLGAGVYLLPESNTGLWMKVHWTNLQGDKLSHLSFFETNKWKDQRGEVRIGYDGEFNDWKYSVFGDWNHSSRNGTESLFNNQGTESGLVKIAEQANYKHSNDQYRATTIWNRKNLFMTVGLGFTDYEERLMTPIRFQKVQQWWWIAGAQYSLIFSEQILKFNLSTQKTTTIEATGDFAELTPESGLSQLLVNNFSYFQMEPWTISASALWNLPFLKTWSPNIGVSYSHATAIRRNEMSIHLGFVF